MLRKPLLSSLVLAALALSPAGAAEPTPKAGCSTLTDPLGDAEYKQSGVKLHDSDPDLDLSGLVLRATSSHLWAYLRISDLKDNTDQGMGHRFDLKFLAGGKTFTIVHGAPRDPYKAAFRFSYPYVVTPTGYDKDAPLTGAWDPTGNLVTFSLPLSYLAQKASAPVTHGLQLTGIAVTSKLLLATPASTVPPTNNQDPIVDELKPADADARWTIGQNSCFEPPASKLSGLSGLSVQYGDAASLSARLTDTAGTTGVTGKPVIFSIPGRSVTATTDGSGVARATLVHGKTAGRYPLTVRFAGDDAAGTASLNGTLVVREETTKLGFKITRHGASRSLTVTLLDDDRHPVAGQTVYFTVGNKTTALRTDGSGVAVFRGAKAGQSVKVEFRGVKGKYGAARTTVRV